MNDILRFNQIKIESFNIQNKSCVRRNLKRKYILRDKTKKIFTTLIADYTHCCRIDEKAQ